MRNDYNKYRNFAESEISVNQAIIDKQNEIIRKMYNELRATKVLVEIPKLQQKMTKYDLRGVDFMQFAKVLNQINKEIRQDLQKQNPGLISEDSDEDFESPRRHKSVQPQHKKVKPNKT